MVSLTRRTVVAFGVLAIPCLWLVVMQTKPNNMLLLKISKEISFSSNGSLGGDGGGGASFSLLRDGLHQQRRQQQQRTEDPMANSFAKLAGEVDCSPGRSWLTGAGSQNAAAFLADEAVLKRASNCDSYHDVMNLFGRNLTAARGRQLDSLPSTPLAFSHSQHQQPALLEVFLALTFRPGDAHCIHIDPKAPDLTRAATEAVVECYKFRYPEANIFIVPNPVPVFWGHMSTLELLNRDKYWKFYLNPASSELPLIPVETMESRLHNIGASIVDSFKNPNKDRHKKVFQLMRHGSKQYDLSMDEVEGLKPPSVPYNLTIRKGSKNVALTREFSEFVVGDPLAIAFTNWIQMTSVPDEHFYSTLATVKSYDKKTNKAVQDLKTDHSHGGCVRLSWWIYGENSKHKCSGRTVRAVCNFGVGDLPQVWREADEDGCLTANKFNLNVDPAAVVCQAKEVVHRTEALYWREKN